MHKISLFDKHSVFTKVVGKRGTFSPSDFLKCISGLEENDKIKDIGKHTESTHM